MIAHALSSMSQCCHARANHDSGRPRNGSRRARRAHRTAALVHAGVSPRRIGANRVPPIHPRVASTGARPQGSGRNPCRNVKHPASPRRGPDVTVVVDASVLVSALVDSGGHAVWAEAALTSDSLDGPESALAEASNILRRLERAGMVSQLQATSAPGPASTRSGVVPLHALHTVCRPRLGATEQPDQQRRLVRSAGRGARLSPGDAGQKAQPRHRPQMQDPRPASPGSGRNHVIPCRG